MAINESTGLRASFFCWGEDEWFLPGTAPSETCGPGWERADRFEPEQPGEEPSVAHRPPRDPVVRFFQKLFRAWH